MNTLSRYIGQTKIEILILGTQNYISINRHVGKMYNNRYGVAIVIGVSLLVISYPLYDCAICSMKNYESSTHVCPNKDRGKLHWLVKSLIGNRDWKHDKVPRESLLKQYENRY